MLNVSEQCLDLQADIKSRGEDTDVDNNVMLSKCPTSIIVYSQ